MRLRDRLGWFLVFLFSGLPAAAAPLSLDAAVAEALAHSPALAARAALVDQAAEEAAAIRAQRLPRIEVDALAGYLLDEVEFVFPRGSLGSYPATGPIPGADIPIVAGDDVAVFADLRVAQPLTRLPRLAFAARAAETGRAVAAADLASARLALIAAVRDLYFGLLETRAALAAGAAALERLRELLRRTTVAAGEQVVLEADLLEARLALASREHQQRQLENAEAGRREELLRLLGRPLDTALELEELPPPATAEGDLAAARAAALARRPELAAARLRAEQAELAAKAEAAGRWPELSLALQYLTPYRVDPLPDHIASLGLQLSWEPWDWGRKRRQAAGRAAAARAARAALEDLESQVATEVGRAFRRLGEARAGIELADLGVAVAEERARVARARFAQEAVTVADLLQAESSLADAAARASAARLELWSAHGAFRRALAEDLP